MQLFTLHAICVAFISHSACLALHTPFLMQEHKAVMFGLQTPLNAPLQPPTASKYFLLKVQIKASLLILGFIKTNIAGMR